MTVQMELENLVWRLGWTPNQALDFLQDSGVISDHCLALSDISLSDQKRAFAFLIHRGGYAYRDVYQDAV